MSGAMKELIKHIPIVSYIDGISILGKDYNILKMRDGSTIELSYKDLIRIQEKVIEKIREYNFSFKSSDGKVIFRLRDDYYNWGRSKAYQLAFKEIVLKENVRWSEVVDFNLSNEIQFNF